MQVTIPEQVIEVPEMIASPKEVGEWMVLAALRVWYGYDDEGTFRDEQNGDVYTVIDIDEEKAVSFTAEQFFAEHFKLIYLGMIDNYRHDWIEFAMKGNTPTPDEYDDNTVDAVLQNMLYGQIVYG